MGLCEIDIVINDDCAAVTGRRVCVGTLYWGPASSPPARTKSSERCIRVHEISDVFLAGQRSKVHPSLLFSLNADAVADVDDDVDDVVDDVDDDDVDVVC